MWIENETLRADLEAITGSSFIPWRELDGKTVLITGATGLIGSTLTNALLYYGLRSQNPPRVLALVRDEKKASVLFASQLAECAAHFELIVGDVCEPLETDKSIDYMIHAASQTDSKEMVEHPVETIETALRGTRNMLALAREKKVSSFVFLSSMEVYGSPTDGRPITESAGACFDSTAVRSSYPESKRMCEALCCACAAEYGVRAKIIRLAQTLGPGVANTDKRIYAQIMRSALNGSPITLATKGDSERMYLYTMDAVAAVLCVLLRGETGCAYNAANKDSYCSIAQLALLAAQTLSDPPVRVLIGEGDANKYPPAHKLCLDTSRLEALGWRATRGLADMFIRMASASGKICGNNKKVPSGGRQ